MFVCAQHTHVLYKHVYCLWEAKISVEVDLRLKGLKVDIPHEIVPFLDSIAKPELLAKKRNILRVTVYTHVLSRILVLKR